MPWPLYSHGKSPWHPLDRRLGGPQTQSRSSGEKKNSQPLLGLESPIIQPVGQSYTTELPQLNNAIFLFNFSKYTTRVLSLTISGATSSVFFVSQDCRNK